MLSQAALPLSLCVQGVQPLLLLPLGDGACSDRAAALCREGPRGKAALPPPPCRARPGLEQLRRTFLRQIPRQLCHSASRSKYPLDVVSAF